MDFYQLHKALYDDEHEAWRKLRSHKDASEVTIMFKIKTGDHITWHIGDAPSWEGVLKIIETKLYQKHRYFSRMIGKLALLLRPGKRT